MNENISFMPVINYPGWANIKDSNELLQKCAVMFALSLVPAVRRAAAAMSEFGRCVKENGFLNDDIKLPGKRSFGCLGKEFCVRMQCVRYAAYLQHHARLPGSRSTARLRKKRKDMVARWFFHYDE